jgi:hypothetical protein
MSDQVTKRQHFVPQFYLRNFLNSRNEVEVFDCDRRVIGSPKGTKGVCYEDYFYGIRTGEPDEVSQQVEKAFQQLEDQIAKGLDPIIDKLLKDAQIEEEEKWLVAYLMSMLWIRGPVFRKQVNRMAEEVTRKVASMMFSDQHIDQVLDRFDKETGSSTSPGLRKQMVEMIQKDEYGLEFSNVHHMQMFTEFQGFANLFHGQDWVVYISKNEEKFVTADNPVVVRVPERKGFYGPTFLERTHYFALTPDICIVARYPTKDAGKKLKRKTLFGSGRQEVVNLNALLASQAHGHAYARDRATLETLQAEIQRREELVKRVEALRAGTTSPRDTGRRR